jgi:hypothetical protein
LNAETARLQAALNRINQYTPYGSLVYSQGTAQQANPQAGGGMTTNQGMGTGTPNAAPSSTQSIYKAEGGNSYRNMNTGALEQFATPPGQDNGSGIFYGGMGMGGQPAGSTTSTPATVGNDTSNILPSDQWSSTLTLSPEGQRQLDLQNQLTNSAYGLGLRNFQNIESAQASPFILDSFGNAPQFSLSGIPDAPVADDATRQRVEQSLFNQARSRLDPVQEQQREALRTRLINQGIPINSEAYGREFDTFNRGSNDLYNSALNNAIAGGGQEQSRLFQLGTAARSNAVNERQLQYGNDTTGRQNAIQEALLARNQPINELAALLGTSAGVQTPSFSQPGMTGVSPTDITGPTAMNYQGALNNYNQQQASNNATMGGLFGLGGSLGSAGLLKGSGGGLGGAAALTALSSKEAKENKRPLATVLDKVGALPVERWTYKADPASQHIGPYAEDFRELFGVGDGTTIFLPDAIGVCLKAIQELTAKVQELEARVA